MSDFNRVPFNLSMMECVASSSRHCVHQRSDQEIDEEMEIQVSNAAYSSIQLDHCYSKARASNVEAGPIGEAKNPVSGSLLDPASLPVKLFDSMGKNNSDIRATQERDTIFSCVSTMSPSACDSISYVPENLMFRPAEKYLVAEDKNINGHTVAEPDMEQNLGLTVLQDLTIKEKYEEDMETENMIQDLLVENEQLRERFVALKEEVKLLESLFYLSMGDFRMGN